MKRDLDLLRQLLIDIENQGTDCAPSVLRATLSEQTDDRIRYHVRQLIDASLVKEVERTMNGAPCVRLTHAGHELIELSLCEARWQEAKWTVRDQTGGESLTVLKAVLTKWAAEEATRGEVRRALPYSSAYRSVNRPATYRPVTASRPTYRRVTAEHRVEPRYRGRSIDSRFVDSRYVDSQGVDSYQAGLQGTDSRLVDRYIDPRYYENRPASVERTTPGEEELRLVQTRPDYLERFDWRNTTDRERFGRGWYAYDSAVESPYSESPYFTESQHYAEASRYKESPYYNRASYARKPYSQAEYAREQATNGEIGISLPIHVV